jgi:surface protein
MKTAALCCLALLLSVQAQAQNDPYITVWNTFFVDDNAISFNAEGDFTYTWEQISGGTATQPIPQAASGNTNITFPSAGEYRLTITPDNSNGTPFGRIYFGDTTTPEKLAEIQQWGDVEWSSFQLAYQGTENLAITAADIPDLGNVANMRAAFKKSGINTVPQINNWDVSNVTNMSEMFHDANSFNQPIGNWNVGNVTNMSGMFESMGFNKSIANWDVSNVTDMSKMFAYCSNFNQPIGNWDVSNVTDMGEMFSHSTNFNQPIGDWDVSNVTDMNAMFYYVIHFNQPIGNWDVGNVTDMSWMFASAHEFNQPIGDWNVNQVTDMSKLFHSADDFNQPIGNWAVGNVTDMSNMFTYANDFNQPIGDWDVSQVTDMSEMFMDYDEHDDFEYYSFDQPIGNWDVSQVTDMRRMFANDIQFNQPIGDWDVSHVTDMSGMFFNADDFNQPIGDWDVSNVTDMSEMFRYAQNFNQPVGNWNVSNVTDMSWMFGGLFFPASNFNQPIGNWDMSHVTAMNSMFEYAQHFDQDLGAWDLASIIPPPPHANHSAEKMFDHSGMGCVNYSKTLEGWAANPNTPSGIVLGADDLLYSPDVAASRDHLVNDLAWDINGDGLGTCSLDPCMTLEAGSLSGPEEICPGEGFNVSVSGASSGDSIVGTWEHSFSDPAQPGNMVWHNADAHALGSALTIPENRVSFISVRYRVSCGTDADTSDVLHVASAATGCAYPVANSSNPSVFIDDVTATGGISSDIGSLNTGYEGNGYGDHRAEVIDLYPGNSMTLDLVCDDAAGTYSYAVWIGWNGQWVPIGSLAGAPGAIHANFTAGSELPIPQLGYFTVRIRNSQSGMPPAAGNWPDGEAEDYTVWIKWPSGGNMPVYPGDAGLLPYTTPDIQVSFNATGIEQPEFSSFTYHPNPAKTAVYLGAGKAITQVEVYDLLGQRMLAAQPATLRTRLDIADLPAGAYLMQVSIDGAKRNYKLIKE